jgi:hypothetical protein
LKARILKLLDGKVDLSKVTDLHVGVLRRELRAFLGRLYRLEKGNLPAAARERLFSEVIEEVLRDSTK